MSYTKSCIYDMNSTTISMTVCQGRKGTLSLFDDDQTRLNYVDAIKKVFGIDYSKRNKNDKGIQGSNAVAGDNEAGSQRQRGSEGEHNGGERDSQGERGNDSGAGTETVGREGSSEVEGNPEAKKLVGKPFTFLAGLGHGVVKSYDGTSFVIEKTGPSGKTTTITVEEERFLSDVSRGKYDFSEKKLNLFQNCFGI